MGLKPNYKILVLGVSDGAFLQKLQQQMPRAEMVGIDVSSEMLTHARERLPSLVTIEACATAADRYLSASPNSLMH